MVSAIIVAVLLLMSASSQYFVVRAAGPSVTSPVIFSLSTSLSLPAGAQVNLFAGATGGANSATAFVTGSYQTVSNALGFVTGLLAVTTSTQDSYQASTANKIIGGVSVSNYQVMTETYAASGAAGTTGVTATFTVPANGAEAVLIGAAGGEGCAGLSGVPGMTTIATDSNQGAADAIAIADAYLAPGTYTGVLSSSACGTTNQATNGVILGVFVFSSTPPTTCAAPTIQLQKPSVSGYSVSVNGITQPGGSSCTITSVGWSFGDGTTTSSWFPVSKTYSSAGTFVVVATTHQSDGQTATASTSVTVPSASSCTVPSISLQTPSVADMTTSLSGNASPGGSSCTISQISESWGDGATTTNPLPTTHTYSVAGSFTITAKATQSDGQTNTATTSVLVPCVTGTSGNQFPALQPLNPSNFGVGNPDLWGISSATGGDSMCVSGGVLKTNMNLGGISYSGGVAGFSSLAYGTSLQQYPDASQSTSFSFPVAVGSFVTHDYWVQTQYNLGSTSPSNLPADLTFDFWIEQSLSHNGPQSGDLEVMVMPYNANMGTVGSQVQTFTNMVNMNQAPTAAIWGVYVGGGGTGARTVQFVLLSPSQSSSGILSLRPADFIQVAINYCINSIGSGNPCNLNTSISSNYLYSAYLCGIEFGTEFGHIGGPTTAIWSWTISQFVIYDPDNTGFRIPIVGQ